MCYDYLSFREMCLLCIEFDTCVEPIAWEIMNVCSVSVNFLLDLSISACVCILSRCYIVPRRFLFFYARRLGHNDGAEKMPKCTSNAIFLFTKR
jgi:hypothetical protein